MKLHEVEKILKNIQNGAFFAYVSENDNPSGMSKKCTDHIMKRTEGTGRTGVQYTHMGAVHEKFVEEGKYHIDEKTGKLVIDAEPLPESWEWYIPNVILFNTNTKQYYIRLYKTPNKPKVQWFINGKEVSVDEVKERGVMTPSYWKKQEKNERLVFNLPIDKLTKIVVKN